MGHFRKTHVSTHCPATLKKTHVKLLVFTIKFVYLEASGPCICFYHANPSNMSLVSSGSGYKIISCAISYNVLRHFYQECTVYNNQLQCKTHKHVVYFMYIMFVQCISEKRMIIVFIHRQKDYHCS